MALPEDQSAGPISASGEVGLKKREDLMGAEQSPHDAGVSASCPVVDKPKPCASSQCAQPQQC